MKKSNLLTIWAANILLIISCAGRSEKKNDKNETTLSESNQVLPDSKSLLFNFGILNIPYKVKSAAYEMSTTNFWRAESKLKLLTKEVNDRLSFAAHILDKGQSHAAQLLSEDLWVSSFNVVSAKNQKYLVNVYSKNIADDFFEWKLELILVENKFDESVESILLMSGKSDASGKGSWKVYDINEQKSSDYEFEIIFDLDTDESRVLGVAFNEPKASYSVLSAGSFVKFIETSTTVSVEIDDVAQPAGEKIVWKKSSLAGAYFDSTGYETCWDSQSKGFVNIACGE